MWSSLHLTKLLFILGFPAENQGAFSSDPLLDVRMRQQHCWKHWKKLILSRLVQITYLKTHIKLIILSEIKYERSPSGYLPQALCEGVRRNSRWVLPIPNVTCYLIPECSPSHTHHLKPSSRVWWQAQKIPNPTLNVI